MKISTILKAAAAPAIIVAGLLASSTGAFASTGPSNGQAGQLTGHNNAAVYTDPVFGPVQCNETQHPAFDTVSCKFTAGQTQAPGATSSVGWNSDFGTNALPSHQVTGTLTYTINPDGSGYTGQATYPNG